jgi:hypothetical protein
MSSTKRYLKLGWFIPFPANCVILASIIYADFWILDSDTERTIILLMFYGAIGFLIGFLIQLMATTVEIHKLKSDLLLPDEKNDFNILKGIRRRAILYTLGSAAFVASRVFLIISFDSTEPDVPKFVYKIGLYIGYSLCCLGGLTPRKDHDTLAMRLLYFCDVLIVISTFALTILCLFFMFLVSKAIYTYWIVLEFLRTLCLGINTLIFIIYY